MFLVSKALLVFSSFVYGNYLYNTYLAIAFVSGEALICLSKVLSKKKYAVFLQEEKTGEVSCL